MPRRPDRKLQPVPRASSQRWLGKVMRGALTIVAALIVGPAGASAAVISFGSPLAVPATLETANGLNYAGTDIPTIADGRGVIVHVNHDGADTVLWNGSLASGTPLAAADGQITEVRLEGCARPARGGPAPNVEIHFQVLVPRPGGGAQIRVTSQAFTIPTCGRGGAGASTITPYHPENLCIGRGGLVAFNDEGGFEPGAYPSGVPYQVIGGVGGSTMHSFLRNNGTNNGDAISRDDRTNHDGFASGAGQELMMQTTLATGPDATPLCPGGSRGLKAPIKPGLIAAVRSGRGYRLSRAGALSLPVTCYQPAGCTGQVVIDPRSSRSGRPVAHLATARFVLKGNHSGRVTLRLGRKVAQRARRRGLPARVTVINEVPAGPSALGAIVLTASKRHR